MSKKVKVCWTIDEKKLIANEIKDSPISLESINKAIIKLLPEERYRTIKTFSQVKDIFDLVKESITPFTNNEAQPTVSETTETKSTDSEIGKIKESIEQMVKAYGILLTNLDRMKSETNKRLDTMHSVLNSMAISSFNSFHNRPPVLPTPPQYYPPPHYPPLHQWSNNHSHKRKIAIIGTTIEQETEIEKKYKDIFNLVFIRDKRPSRNGPNEFLYSDLRDMNYTILMGGLAKNTEFSELINNINGNIIQTDNSIYALGYTLDNIRYNSDNARYNSKW